MTSVFIYYFQDWRVFR